MSKFKLEDLISSKAEVILEEVDYDILKEDLEEGGVILKDIEYRLKEMLTDVCDKFTLDEILDYINR